MEKNYLGSCVGMACVGATISFIFDCFSILSRVSGIHF